MMTKMDTIRTKVKALKGAEFVAVDVKEDGEDKNFHVRVATLLKNNEITAIGKTKHHGHTVTVYREFNLRKIGLPARTPFERPLSYDSNPWAGTWLELPIPAPYLGGRKTTHYGLSRSDSDDE